ncbi:hypothetical protein D8Y20_13390 [Mariprofundus sp. EBB-1]|uniref:hypothetical protein n=1 Tax=Mariprofundus sp. EBB-1 TaxID=2650971 RepID=UPI000EF1DB82|nr:hypothetical protein [Mariprofundus sp. EBB-1]RLL48991.1 hypothetical protein D8Y20_13390 [Mariprofundus sp. EBB-1]
MSDIDSEINLNNTEKPTEQERSCSKSCRCSPHLSLYISIAALLLAGYAVYANNSTHDNSAMQSQIANLETKTADISDQLSTLSNQVQSNRENLVQTKLKKALENIRDISNLAEEGTKAAISEVESILQNLTDIGDQIKTPEATETPTASDVIKTQHSDTSAAEPAATSPIKTNANDAKTAEETVKLTNSEPANTSSAKSVLSELLDTATTDKTETTTADTNTVIDKPADSATQSNEVVITPSPTPAPSGAQAF